MIRVTFQRIQPNTMQVCGYRKLIFIVGHNESIVAHASSESSCETGGKLKGSPRNSMLFLRHRRPIIDPFSSLCISTANKRQCVSAFSDIPSSNFDYTRLQFVFHRFETKFFISNLPLDAPRYENLEISDNAGYLPFYISNQSKNQKSIHTARIFRNKIHGSYFPVMKLERSELDNRLIRQRLDNKDFFKNLIPR